jgi:flagellar biogenesis protein FliO
MSENDDLDPAANTQMFQAFVDRPEPETSSWKRVAVFGGALAGLAIVVALAWLALG